jgi:hypothetical protein
VLLFSACNKSGNENDNTPVSGLMAFNLAPDLSLAGFAISGNNLTPSPLAFNNYTGVYLRIYPGSRSLESYNFSSGAALATTTYNFEASKYYSVFLAGTDSGYQNIIVNDNIDSLTPSTQAFARYVNAIPDASAPTVTITSNGSNVVNDNASFTSVSEFTAINPGPVTINVSNGGTINANRTITLEQGKVYTLLLSGRPGGTGDNAVQIKYIQNGTVDASADKVSSSSARSIN